MAWSTTTGPDSSPSSAEGSGFDERDAALPEAETQQLLSFARAHRLTLNTLVQAAYALLLSRANGDDVVGLTRGFLYAGVGSIVSSLWKIDDRATSLLMQHFYRSLQETDKRSALRTAQLRMQRDGLRHPFYWAAFQLTGAPVGAPGAASPR